MKRRFKYFFLAAICFLPILVNAQQRIKNLEFYLAQAKASSPVFKDLQRQQKSAGIDSLIARAGAKPQVTLTSSSLYAPIIHGYGYDEVLSNGQSLDAMLNVNYDLLNKKRINNQLEGIKLQSDSIKYAAKRSFLDLDRSIADQYIIAYASQDQVDFNIEVINLLRKEEVLLKTLTRSNIYKQSEYLTFLVTLKQQELALGQASLQLKNDLASLNYLSGIIDTTLVRLEKPTFKYENLMKETGFFKRKFELDSLKNLNQESAVGLNYTPKLGIYANGGYSSSLVLQPYKNFGASVGFTFSVPIYDGHQKKMQYNKLQLSARTIADYRDFFNRQQQQQLNLIQQQIAQTDLLFSKINDQIRLSKGLMEADARLMHTGDLRVADFVIAINNYLSAQNLLRQTTVNRLKLFNQYNYWNR